MNLSDRKGARGIYVRRLLATRKPQGRAALIKQTQCTTQFCIQVGCPSPRRRFPRTIDRYYLGVQWTPSKSLRYLYLSDFLGSLSASDAPSFHNGFSCSPISSRSSRDRVDSGADFNAVSDSATLSFRRFRDGRVRKVWEKYKSVDWKITERYIRHRINISHLKHL